jgi:hypothetical protein
MLVSTEPETKKSPKGWKSTVVHTVSCAVSVLASFGCGCNDRHTHTKKKDEKTEIDRDPCIKT